ncbi:hypothetical protein PsYK624_106130 [Phanerochaete sordida]|uniref:Protein kinase domain-containing protein n=1 Tax=Phanerochaete sordida TaxID=48140 RepID=A0A9P3GE75_9APHY|nr:hypothetical protein PsYK624_106130 [Phanerochaete sordida]
MPKILLHSLHSQNGQNDQYKTEALADRVYKELVAQGDYVEEAARWKAFPQDPAKLNNENIAFQQLLAVVHAIDKALKTTCQIDQQQDVATTWLVLEPNRSPAHVHRRNKTKPDGVFVKGLAEILRWVSVASCGEFKREDSIKVLNDDIQKTMWNLHHLMREDPRRRFAYSFTIENRTMRLWFCNRSTYVISEPFDFCSEPIYIIRYFLSMMYASEAQLGWDTTMVPVEVDGHMQYDITVDDTLFPGTGKSRVYRTSKLLSNVGTFAVRGRATRVWKAKLLKDGQLVGDDVAIRDNWIDADRPREADVINQILDDVPPDVPNADNPDPEYSKNTLRDHMLTVLASGDVVVDDHLDRTQPAPLTFTSFTIRQEDKSEKAQSRRTKDKAALQEELKNHHEEVDDMMPIPPHHSEQYHVKVHHRIVYKEVCIPLHEVKTLDEALYTILQAADALEIVHSAGWVHRDISGGNILLYGEHVKLSDFEYAKKFDCDIPGGTHEIKTGTAAYMSIEVSMGEYLFLPDRAMPKKEASSTAEHPRKRDKRRAGKRMASGPPTINLFQDHHSPAVWHYNPINDMESLWWAAAYFVFDKDVKFISRDPLKFPLPDEMVESADVRRARLLRQHAFSEPLFHTLDISKRMSMVGSSGTLTKAIPVLHPYLQGQIAPALESLRQVLATCYREAEKEVEKIGRSVATPLYEAFNTHIDLAVESAYHAWFYIEIRALATTIADEGIVIERAWGEEPEQPAAAVAQAEAEPAEAAHPDNEEADVETDGDDNEMDVEESDEDSNEGRRKRTRLV